MRKTTVSLPTGRIARRLVGLAAAALAVSGCMTAGLAFADDATDDNPYGLTETPTYLQAGLYSDQEASDGLSTMSVDDEGTEFPEALDLRHYNGKATYDAESGKTVITGGINYVTSVKLQNPFGSCWAFSIISASEVSLLTSLDKADDGEMNGSVDYEKAAAGEAGNIAYNASDLSERALAYSIFTYPTSSSGYSTQAGEGAYLVNGVMGDGAQILNNGGMPFSGVSTFSCGIGPVPEYYAPYISDEGWVDVYIPQPVLTTSGTYTLNMESFTTMKAAQAYYESVWNEEVIAELNETYGFTLTMSKVKPQRSSSGTWSVSTDKIYGHTVAELSESKILEVQKGDGLTSDEIALMKQELMEGRAISIAFCADQSRPGQSISASSSYMNTENWAQYTYDQKNVNHGVTIVGYDDNYAKENFTHDQYSVNAETGELELDAEKTAQTTPEGDGAWIVKNSWGSATADNLLDQNDWGNEGYFYLSYYDKNIANMESFEFDTSAEAQERSSYVTDQYDLSKGAETESQASETEVKTCNVYYGPEEGENAIEIRDLGCITGAANDTVTFEIYVMDTDADTAVYMAANNPIMTTDPETFGTSGFHRVHLDTSLVVNADVKIAIVQTTQRSDESYETTVIRGYSQEFAEAFNSAHTTSTGVSAGSLGSYTYTVVNEGESFVCLDGEWVDWTKFIETYGAEANAKLIAEVQGEAAQFRAMAALDPDNAAIYEELAANVEAFTVKSAYAYDNFSIKYYADEVTDPIDISDANVKLDQKSFVFDGTAKTPEVVSVTLDDGTVLSGADFTVEYSDNVEIGAALVTVTGTGNYTGSTSVYFKIAKPATGWVKKDGAWYYVDPTTCLAVTGWTHGGYTDGSWYYMNANGTMATGWVKVGGSWYYLKSSGKMATGWTKVGGSWYYLGTNGKMATGWVKISGKWYYLLSSGKMVANTTKTISGKSYTFDKNGVWVK